MNLETILFPQQSQPTSFPNYLPTHPIHAWQVVGIASSKRNAQIEQSLNQFFSSEET